MDSFIYKLDQKHFNLMVIVIAIISLINSIHDTYQFNK